MTIIDVTNLSRRNRETGTCLYNFIRRKEKRGDKRIAARYITTNRCIDPSCLVQCQVECSTSMRLDRDLNASRGGSRRELAINDGKNVTVKFTKALKSIARAIKRHTRIHLNRARARRLVLFPSPLDREP